MKSLWRKIKILFLLIIAGGAAYGLFQLSTLVDNNMLADARHDEPEKTATEIQQEITAVLEEHTAVAKQVEEEIAALEALEITVDSNSPEIPNTDYSWLQGAVKRCHPTMRNELKTALENDDVIRKDEYDAIMDRCRTFVQEEASDDKNKLKRFLAE